MSDVLYFAYGSNLLRERLLARCSGIELSGLATLPDHCMTFSKPSTDGSAKCTYARDDGGSVLGALWHVPESDLAALDQIEGVGYGYGRYTVTVIDPSGDATEAVTYRGDDHDASLKPYDWYLALVIAGAMQRGLPASFIQSLQSVPFAVDVDLGRASRLAALDALVAAGMMEVLHDLAR